MKNKSLLKKLVSLSFAFILLCINEIPVHAAHSNSTSVTNQGKVGAVDIELHQSFPKEQTTLLPGQTVSIKSSIENKDEPAWIRVKLEYPSSGKEGLKELEDKFITFADGAWEKIGSYYYLKEPVDSGDTVSFTEALQFPGDWDNTMVNATLGMIFTSEAIQEKNFTPDFTSDDPWHGAVIEAFDGNDYTRKEEGSEQFSVIYENGSKGMIHVGDDFFSNWENLMPGDELDGEATIENHMNLPVEIYFEAESSGNSDLLDQIGITITNGSDVIYDGPLSGSIKPSVLLKQYGKDESTTFQYHLSIPAELNNAYALSEFKTIWTFSAKEIQPEEPDLVERIIEVIKTGEYNTVICIIGLIIVIITSGILYIRRRRRTDV